MLRSSLTFDRDARQANDRLTTLAKTRINAPKYDQITDYKPRLQSYLSLNLTKRQLRATLSVKHCK